MGKKWGNHLLGQSVKVKFAASSQSRLTDKIMAYLAATCSQWALLQAALRPRVERPDDSEWKRVYSINNKVKTSRSVQTQTMSRLQMLMLSDTDTWEDSPMPELPELPLRKATAASSRPRPTSTVSSAAAVCIDLTMEE